VKGVKTVSAGWETQKVGGETVNYPSLVLRSKSRWSGKQGMNRIRYKRCRLTDVVFQGYAGLFCSAFLCLYQDWECHQAQ